MKKKRFSIKIIIVVLVIIAFGIQIRVQNLNSLEGKYLRGTDAYRYFHLTKLIVENGGLPDIDKTRNFPDGVNLAERDNFLSRMLASLYSLIHLVSPSITLFEFTSLYPPILAGIALIFFFLLTRKLFQNFTALLAVSLLATLPIFVMFTNTGYVDKDPLVISLLFIGAYFYALSFNTNSNFYQLVFAGISGGFLGFLGIAWIGSGIIFLIFCIFELLLSWGRSYTKRDIFRFSCWTVSTLSLTLSMGKMYWEQPLAAFAILVLYIPIATWCIVMTVFAIQRNSRLIAVFSKRLHLSVGLSMSVLPIIIAAVAFTLYYRDFSWIEELAQHLRYPYGKNGVMEFVSELKFTELKEWRNIYGINGLMALAGFCMLTYRIPGQTIRSFLAHSFIGIVGFMAIAIRDYIPQIEIFGGISSQTGLIIFGNVCLLISLISIARSRFLVDSTVIAENTNEFGLFLTAWFIISWNLASSSIRFHLFLAPISVILACYFFGWLLQKATPVFSHPREQITFVLICFVWQGLINGIDVFSFGLNVISLGSITAKFSGRIQLLITILVTAFLSGVILQNVIFKKASLTRIPRIIGTVVTILLIWSGLTGLYTLRSVERGITWGMLGKYPDHVTLEACEWLQKNVPQNAVIAANWDYGCVINEIGNRTTVVDEEQNIPRIMEMSREVFCGSEESALKFFKQYGVTHILLSSIDIGNLNIFISNRLQTPDNMYALMFAPKSNYDDGTWHFAPQKNSAILNFNIDNVVQRQMGHSIKSISVHYTPEMLPSAEKPPDITVQSGEQERSLNTKEIIIGDQSRYFPDGQMDGTIWCLGGMKGRTYRNELTTYLSGPARECFLVKAFLGECKDNFKLIYESDASDIPKVKILEVRDVNKLTQITMK